MPFNPIEKVRRLCKAHLRWKKSFRVVFSTCRSVIGLLGSASPELFVYLSPQYHWSPHPTSRVQSISPLILFSNTCWDNLCECGVMMLCICPINCPCCPAPISLPQLLSNMTLFICCPLAILSPVACV